MACCSQPHGPRVSKVLFSLSYIHTIPKPLSPTPRSYKKLAEDVKPGSQILCADGSIVLEVLETDPAKGIVTCRCQNNAKLG